MAQIARGALGDTVYLFNEQFVIKAAERGMKFGWHQDSGFIHYPHEPYLTCWIALDDVTEENGTVYLLPYSRAGTRDVVEHFHDEETNDLIGYFGDDPGDPVIVPAGSIACFSSTLFHRSGPNMTDACAASTSRSTPPSRSSTKIAPDRCTSPIRSRPTAARIDDRWNVTLPSSAAGPAATPPRSAPRSSAPRRSASRRSRSSAARACASAASRPRPGCRPPSRSRRPRRPSPSSASRSASRSSTSPRRTSGRTASSSR